MDLILIVSAERGGFATAEPTRCRGATECPVVLHDEEHPPDSITSLAGLVELHSHSEFVANEVVRGHVSDAPQDVIVARRRLRGHDSDGSNADLLQ